MAAPWTDDKPWPKTKNPWDRSTMVWSRMDMCDAYDLWLSDEPEREIFFETVCKFLVDGGGKLNKGTLGNQLIDLFDSSEALPPKGWIQDLFVLFFSFSLFCCLVLFLSFFSCFFFFFTYSSLDSNLTAYTDLQLQKTILFLWSLQVLKIKNH